MALKRKRLAGVVSGFVRRKESIPECKKRGAVDFATLDLSEAAIGADLVVLCTPLGQMRPLLKLMLPHLRPETIVTDVGSVKGSVVRELEGLAEKAGVHFIGSHPMAGAEKMGVRAARPDLFEGAVCVVTPTRNSDRAAIGKAERLWKSVGARVVALSPEVHDRLVSRSSHLPHLVAATLANSVLSGVEPNTRGMLCANGFRDTTRIASGSPEMWRDIAVANATEIEKALAGFITELEQVRELVSQRNSRRIERVLSQAKRRRDHWVKKEAVHLFRARGQE
jgi:prephenate dehydrogenase